MADENKNAQTQEPQGTPEPAQGATNPPATTNEKPSRKERVMNVPKKGIFKKIVAGLAVLGVGVAAYVAGENSGERKAAKKNNEPETVEADNTYETEETTEE